MHRALGIAEVVQEIVDHVDFPSLRSLARTSRIFSDPVNARRWKRIHSKGIRALLTNVTRASGDFATDVTIRSRCRSLAKFVRSVDLSYFAGNEAGLQEIQAGLVLLRHPSFPFPRLRHIDVRANYPVGIETADMMLCPTVESFTLNVEVYVEDVSLWEGRLFTLLDSLAAKAPRVSALHIKTHTDWDGQLEEFELRLANMLALVSSCLPLVHFTGETVPVIPELVSSLASITELRSLNLRMSYNTNAEVDSVRYEEICRTAKGFRKLRQVSLGGTGDVLVRLLRCSTHSPLEDLDLEQIEWGPFVSDILEVTCSFAKTLIKLHMHGNFDYEGVPEYIAPVYTVPADAFMRLSECSSMQDFRFYFSQSPTPLVDLRNSDLNNLARAWRYIQRFDLTYSWAPDSVVTLNLEALTGFAQCCPDLRHICINPLDSDLNVIFPTPFEIARPWKILYLDYPDSFANLSVASYSKIAFYLNALWADVFLWILPCSPHQDVAESMNEVLSLFRMDRAMRPGTRWRIASNGNAHILSDRTLNSHVRLPRMCPWEIVDEEASPISWTETVHNCTP